MQATLSVDTLGDLDGGAARAIIDRAIAALILLLRTTFADYEAEEE